MTSDVETGEQGSAPVAGPPARSLPVGRLIAFAVIVGALTLRWMHASDWPFVDLVDFVEGGRSVIEGRPIYDAISGVLPFNYPPFGAVVMVPLALAGLPAAKILATALSFGCYVLILVVIGRRLSTRPVTLMLVGLAGLALEPLIRLLVLGQINLWLAALVVLDLFVVPRRFRGLLIGVAAGVKLTPAIFSVIYLVRRDWSSLARSLAGFAFTVLVGWLLAPTSSLRYWLQDFDKTGRFGGDALMTANQSLRAVLVHALGTETPPPALWLAVAALSVAAAVWVCARRLTVGDDVGAMLALAVGGLLASPISWSHHWVWVVPGLLYALSKGRVALAWFLGAVLFVAPMWLLPAGNGAELRFTPWQVVVSAPYVVVGVVALILLALPSNPPRARLSG